MKRILNKIRRRKVEPVSRITSETVSEHREKILAGGRRFKYPIQYVKHRLVINAILISLVALITTLTIGWFQLYSVQNSSELMYRITKVIPVPIANVDGQFVLYSDYLMVLRSSTHYLEKIDGVDLKSKEGKERVNQTKQQSMQSVIKSSYAAKLAKDYKINVSDAELDDVIKAGRVSINGEVSEQTYYAVVLDYYNWSPSEYRYHMKNELLRQKVEYAMDKNAINTINGISDTLKATPGTDFKALATQVSGEAGKKAAYGISGWVPKANKDGGLAVESSKLTKGQVSLVIKSTVGDGYYIVRTLDINDTKVSYEYIKVPLTAFTKSLNDVISANKVDYFISIPKS